MRRLCLLTTALPALFLATKSKRVAQASTSSRPPLSLSACQAVSVPRLDPSPPLSRSNQAFNCPYPSLFCIQGTCFCIVPSL
ncbi:hypothetical protein F5H01DRAFT_329635 [Linnemannia elongata]|nr:hypothetical protein F5H01DRAFT_329635 [Linnemannia elongata]